MNDTWSFLAQTTPSQPGSGFSQLFPFALMLGVVAFLLLTARSQRKREQRERESLLSRIARNDRILTAGGIIGTVLNVKDDEVVLKIDETTNAKMTVIKSAVQRILADESAAEKR